MLNKILHILNKMGLYKRSLIFFGLCRYQCVTYFYLQLAAFGAAILRLKLYTNYMNQKYRKLIQADQEKRISTQLQKSRVLSV